jgi:hypothetical protein
MPGSYFWLLYVHIVMAALFLGGMVLFQILLASLRWRLSPTEYASEVVSILRFFHPLLLLFMGLLILTGAWNLTDLKTAMGLSFGKLFFLLAFKLGGVFLLVMGMSFQFFAFGLRLTRGTGPTENGRPLADTFEERLRLLRVVGRINLANIVITLFTFYFALALGKGI